MAYIVGLVTPKERLELQRRGWTFEPAPEELTSSHPADENADMETLMVWVDRDMFQIMDGPDWQK